MWSRSNIWRFRDVVYQFVTSFRQPMSHLKAALTVNDKLYLFNLMFFHIVDNKILYSLQVDLFKKLLNLIWSFISRTRSCASYVCYLWSVFLGQKLHFGPRVGVIFQMVFKIIYKRVFNFIVKCAQKLICRSTLDIYRWKHLLFHL